MAANWSRPGEYREIIQIGAIHIGPGPELEERGVFSCLVRPEKNPRLSDYIIALTGISQAMINANAVTFTDAQSAFDAFVGDTKLSVYCNGGDHEIMAENARWHDLAPSQHISRMINFRRHLADMLGVGSTDFHSIQVAELAGAAHEDARDHDALADVRTLAAGLRHLIMNTRL